MNELTDAEKLAEYAAAHALLDDLLVPRAESEDDGVRWFTLAERIDGFWPWINGKPPQRKSAGA